MVVLNSFLGCFKLRTGCLFMGYSGAICSILGIIASIAGVIITAMRQNHIQEKYQPINEFLMGACIALLLICSFTFSIYVVLLVGLNEYRPKLLKVFLISMTTYLVIWFVLSVIISVAQSSYAIQLLVSYAWNIYYMLVVRSYYLKMNEESQLKNGMKPV